MTDPRRPAAYLRARPDVGAPALAWQRQAIAEAARRRGWPAPAIYADEGTGPPGGDAPALAMLSAAIAAGRHDAVLLPAHCAAGSIQTRLMSLLLSCTRHGVAAEIILTPAAIPDRPSRTAPGRSQC